MALTIPQCAPKTQNNPHADPSPFSCIQSCHFCHDSSQKKESHHPDLFAFGQLPTGQNKVLLSPHFKSHVLWLSSSLPIWTVSHSDLEMYYLNCDSILFDFILGHLSAISAPLGHHFRLAERDLVHLLDVVVQVACRTACVLTDGTYPWLCSAAEYHK